MMKIMEKAIVILSIILIPISVFAKSDCEVRDISGGKTEKEIKLLKLTGNQWMQTAIVCQIGEYVVAVPKGNSKNDANIILLLKEGKPVFYRNKGGTYIYSPNLMDAAFDKVLVHLWHGDDDGEIDRIWYQTVGKVPEIQIDDTNFDGHPDIKAIWINQEIVKLYEWKNNRWQQKEVKNNNP